MRPLAVIALVLLLAGCAVQETVHKKDGKTYGVTSGLFRDRWWNYYERGLSFAEGEFYDEALGDLRTAIKGRKDDRWRSRTYGMHFMDYFPHRELGVIYYNLDRHKEAKEELENSLKTAESAKAKYFLNKTRRAILNESGADRASPSLDISQPQDGAVTNRFSINLIGEAEDDQFVYSVSINRVPLPLELSARKVPLNEVVQLKRGINEIRVLATDLTGKAVERTLKVHADMEGPVIIIDEQRKTGGKAVISGYLSDDSGIASFKINGQEVPLIYNSQQAQGPGPGTGGQTAEFRKDVEPGEGMGTVKLETRDIAGNITRGRLYMNSGPGVEKDNTGSGINGLPLLASAMLKDPQQYAFTDNILGRIIDSIPPVINLKDLADFQTVYSESLYIEGSVSDKSSIKTLLINGESILRREGKKIFFNYLTKLKEGGNSFIIEAADSFGNRVQKAVAVNRKIRKVRTIGSRLSMSILPLEHRGEQSVLKDAVYDGLISAFVNQKRFRIIEREKIEDVLRELKLGQTGLIDPETAVRAGKMAAADTILTGTVYETRDSVEIVTRLIDTETSAVIEAKDVFDQDRSLKGSMTLAEGLALKYKQSLPLVEGIVIKKDGKAVLVDIGIDKNIKKSMSVIIYREGEEIRHPLTERVLGSESVELGEARLENVYREFSRAVIKKGRPAKIRVRDRIITK